MTIERSKPIAAGWAGKLWCIQRADGSLAYYRPQVEPCVAKEYKADLARQIRNLKKRLSRAVKREAVAA